MRHLEFRRGRWLVDLSVVASLMLAALPASATEQSEQRQEGRKEARDIKY